MNGVVQKDGLSLLHSQRIPVSGSEIFRAQVSGFPEIFNVDFGRSTKLQILLAVNADFECGRYRWFACISWLLEASGAA